MPLPRHSPVVAGLVEEPLVGELKRRARAMWAAGDYAAIAARELWPLGERAAGRAAIRPGDDVLDVACGTGNAAIRAAEAGGRVVALDLTPELLDTGRELAAAAGVDVDWVEGDAEALPFPDASFDVVLSTVGVMFAPRHRIAAGELVRVLRPRGRIVLCNWAEGSVICEVLRTVARYLPPPPDFVAPPWLWGSEQHVRGLFAPEDVDLSFERGRLHFPPFDSAAADVEFHSTRLGPLVAVRAQTEADGRWPSLREELERLHDGLDSAEYLLVVGRRR